MIVCVPAIPRNLHRSTVPSIVQAGFDCVVCDVEKPAHSDFGVYLRWWITFPNGFFVVNHDIEILPSSVTETQSNILEEMANCDNSWCQSAGVIKYLPMELRLNWGFAYEFVYAEVGIRRSLEEHGYECCTHRRGTHLAS